MIPNEAVEAALKAVDPDERGWISDSDMRAALEAALPHLIASQGCGTGHSADAGSLPALADKMELSLCAYWLDECARYFEKRPTNGEDAAHWSNVANAENARKYAALICSLIGTPDGGEAVHSPAEREGSRDEPKTDEYEGCGRCVYCTDLGAHELCRGYDLPNPTKEA